jgi:energy-coupling factor transport system ATP-binding protein
MAGLEGESLRESVRWAMESVGLDFEDFKDRPVFALSGGEKRKVALAGVLAMKPQILLLDEPTAGLDPRSRSELWDTLRRLNGNGMSLVIATHSMDEAAATADRIYVLAGGAVLMKGIAEEIFSQSERLEALSLGVPFSQDLMRALRDRGWHVPPSALNIVDAERAVVDYLSAGRTNR